MWKTILARLFWSQIPLRQVIAQRILRWAPVSYATRIRYDAVRHPQYGYCIHRAALLAKALDLPAFSVLEFGVAAGEGLLNAERHAQLIETELGVRIEIYGFDLGSGLPKPLDYRDLPCRWQQGFFELNRAELERKLERAKLVFGDVKETVGGFAEKYRPAPIGAVFFDLDYYSSTIDALRVFDTAPANYLPRVYCYLDDIVDGGDVGMNEFLGELAAIREYNESNPTKKIAKIHALRAVRVIPAVWNEQIFVHHDFEHPRYNDFSSEPDQQFELPPDWRI